ncbi:unnamed protein product [Didymodactylos carnosus]|uniref:BTB domain-containing protein n=1 Tax=Didymodactylos carnosus TaxID=1234261 RepID=A0A813YGH1_9BILA|nr:unnamed protein product [Didymodactylos carnosus]CAF0883925.1 unnamed protein product [Didymodactylos carnosus]CAF3585009.1 unnamed protein product [Didymodactylos carnosus]CAF3669536.1 unnamed protein product [Didymodactylos carnosus]
MSKSLLLKQCEELSHLLISIKKNIEILPNELSPSSLLKKETIIHDDVVMLNVGGREFQTTIRTLTKEKPNTFFTELFAREWESEKDARGRLFVDRNSDLFAEILDYMRTGEFILPEEERLRKRLITEVKFYRLNTLFDILTVPDKKFQGGTTLLNIQQQQKLNEFYGVKNQNWQMIYKATRDGFNAKDFHRLCDKEDETMTVIKSIKSYLFGGYSPQSWSPSGTYSIAPNSFLFLLTNSYGNQPTKFTSHQHFNSNAVYNYADHGPAFGEGADLRIQSESNTNTNSYTNFPSTYMDTLGHGQNTFTGERNFQTSDIEVFKLLI